jgi:hypothetical protein
MELRRPLMRVFTGAIATISLCGANIGMSHHSPASVYVMSETIQIDGIVTDFRYNNPLMRIFIDVTNEDGETESWIAEGGTRIFCCAMDGLPRLSSRATGFT